MCKKWKEEQQADPSSPPFEEWVQGVAKREAVDVITTEDLDRLLLSWKPAQRAMRYTKMKAFRNHFKVDNAASIELQMFDSETTSMFEVPTANTDEVSVNYVGVLKDILKLDYGLVHTPLIILRCEWMKRQDNRGNPT